MEKILITEDIKIPGTNIILEKGDCIYLKEDNEVNIERKKTSVGEIEIVKPNSKGKLVLPKDWYEPEDDVYDEIYKI